MTTAAGYDEEPEDEDEAAALDELRRSEDPRFVQTYIVNLALRKKKEEEKKKKKKNGAKEGRRF